MGGGGSKSKSSVKQKSNTLVTNKSNLNLLNQTINNTIVNTTVENVKRCSASLVQNQNIQIIGLIAGGDIKITSEQVQIGMLNFACAQTDDVKNDVSAKLANQIMTQLQNNVDNSILDKMNGIASAKSKKEWGAFPFGGGSNSDSKANQEVKTNIKNMTSRDIKNVVKNAVTANFTSKNFDNCLSKVIANQEFLAKNLTAGKNITLTLKQDQATKIFAQCIQNAQISNKITHDVATFFGVKVQDDTKNKVSKDLTAGAFSESLAGGPLEGLGRGIGEIFSGLLSPFNSLFGSLGSMGGIVGTASAACCACICCIIIIFVVIALIGNLT